jgi:hypothetical protein
LTTDKSAFLFSSKINNRQIFIGCVTFKLKIKEVYKCKMDGKCGLNIFNLLNPSGFSTYHKV